MQPIIHTTKRVDEFDGGWVLMTVPNKFTLTKSRVISNAILPGTTSGGTMKLIQDTMTNITLGK